MIASFADGSSDSVNAIAGMAGATDEQLATMVANWKTLQQEQQNAAGSVADLKTDFTATMDELQTALAEDIEAMDLGDEAKASAQATIQGFIDGAVGMLPQVTAAYNRVAAAARAALSASGTGTAGSIPGYAVGTQSAAPGFALVGENGPELVYFNGGEQVMTAEETAAMRESMEIQAVTFAPQLLEALHAIHGDGALSAEPGAGSGAGSVELQIVFQINGGASPETVEALREYGDEFAERVLEVMEEAGIDTARRAYLPWSGMDEYNIINNAVSYKKGQSGFSRSSYDTVVFIPEYYFRIIDDAANKKRYFYIADKAKSGFTKHPGSGKYVGRYNTISGHYSKTGAAPLVNLTRASARSGARGKGSKWSEYDFASWCAVWLLYLVEFSDWDSQSKIGRGYVDGNGSAINSGGTDSMTYHTGRAAGTDGKTAVQYRHIENPYGNIFEFIDGINFSDGTVYVCLNPASYADDTATNYTNIGSKIQGNGYITAIGVSSAMPWAFCPTAVGGSETTYIPDYASCSSGWRFLFVGGDWNDGGDAGLFYFDADSTSSNTYSSVGARLLFHP